MCEGCAIATSLKVTQEFVRLCNIIKNNMEMNIIRSNTRLWWREKERKWMTRKREGRRREKKKNQGREGAQKKKWQKKWRRDFFCFFFSMFCSFLVSILFFISFFLFFFFLIFWNYFCYYDILVFLIQFLSPDHLSCNDVIQLTSFSFIVMPSHQVNEFNSIKTNNDFKFMKKKC